MKMHRSLLAGLALGVLAAPVHAQPARAWDTGPIPVGATTDRVGDERFAIGLDLAYPLYDNDFADFFAIDYGLRFDLHGQFLTDIEAGLVGGYLSLPYAHMSLTNDSESTVGNIELGAVFMPDSLSLPVLFRAGLVLGTLGDDLRSVATSFATSFPRVTDMPSQRNNTSWLRLAASPVHHAGNIVLRADLGLDIPISDGEINGFEIDEDPVGRVTLSAGIDLGLLTLLGELATVFTLGDVDDDDDRFLHTLAITARANGSVAPFASVVLPLDESLRDFYTAALLVGLRMAPALH